MAPLGPFDGSTRKHTGSTWPLIGADRHHYGLVRLSEVVEDTLAASHLNSNDLAPLLN